MNLSSGEIMTLVRSALGRGQRVKLSVKGISMLPFLWEEDVVEIGTSSNFKLGDVVLVQINLPNENDRYLLHRIVKLHGEHHFYIRGDSQFYSEGPFHKDNILGCVIKSWHNGHERNYNHFYWRWMGLIWIYTSPFGTILLKLLLRVRFIVRTIVN